MAQTDEIQTEPNKWCSGLVWLDIQCLNGSFEQRNKACRIKVLLGCAELGVINFSNKACLDQQ